MDIAVAVSEMEYIMDFDEFMQSGERRFIDPCLKAFSFLEEDAGFSVSGVAAGCETSIIYISSDIYIKLGFAIMEVPYLTLQQIKDGKVKNEKFFSKPKTEQSDAVFRLEKSRNKLSPDVWCKNMRRGDYDFEIEAIIMVYASAVHNHLSEIIKGQFSFVI